MLAYYGVDAKCHILRNYGANQGAYNRGHQTFFSEGRITARLTASGRVRYAITLTSI